MALFSNTPETPAASPLDLKIVVGIHTTRQLRHTPVHIPVIRGVPDVPQGPAGLLKIAPNAPGLCLVELALGAWTRVVLANVVHVVVSCCERTSRTQLFRYLPRRTCCGCYQRRITRALVRVFSCLLERERESYRARIFLAVGGGSNPAYCFVRFGSKSSTRTWTTTTQTQPSALSNCVCVTEESNV